MSAASVVASAAGLAGNQRRITTKNTGTKNTASTVAAIMPLITPVPMARWLAGPLRDWAEALLDPQLLRNQGCFDVARVRGIWEAFLRGERKWHTHLWNVLMFQAWHQHWHGGRGR